MYSLHRHTYLKYIYFCYKCKEYLFCCKRNQKSKYISAVLCKSHSPVTIPCLTVQKQRHLLHIAPWPLTTTPARDSVCMFSSTFFFFFYLPKLFSDFSIYTGRAKAFLLQAYNLIRSFSGCHSICPSHTLWKDKSKNVLQGNNRHVYWVFRSVLTCLFQTEAKAPCKNIRKQDYRTWQNESLLWSIYLYFFSD